MRRDVFFSPHPGRCNRYTYKFNIKPGFSPGVCKVYTVPRFKIDLIRDTVERWVRDGIIQLSNSPYRVPFIAAPKGPNEWRPCGDFRSINEYLITHGNVLPKTAELKTRFGSAKYYTSIDFNEAFLQIPLNKDQRKYFAFNFEGTPYEYTVIPYSTNDSMQGFLAASREVLNGMESFVAIYVDDILVYSDILDYHRIHVFKVIDAIKEVNMTLKLAKCKFFRPCVKFLGYKISRLGIEPLPDRVEAIQNFPRPKSKKEMQSFLGVINFYRAHIPDCAQVGKTSVRTYQIWRLCLGFRG